MIKQIFLDGFKSFAGPTLANIDELLVIAGSNSGGKSTIIQALLLLSQTLDNPGLEGTLDLGGKYVQFAEFSEIVYGRPKPMEAKFTVGFDLLIEEPDFLYETVLEDAYYLRRYRHYSKQVTEEELPMTSNDVTIRITFGSNRSGAPLISHASYQKIIKGFGQINFTLSRESGTQYRIVRRLSAFQTKIDISPKNIIKKLEELINQSEPLSGGSRSPRFYDRGFREPLLLFGITLSDVPIIGSDLTRTWKKLENVEFDQKQLLYILRELLCFVFQEGIEISKLQKVPFDQFLPISLSRLFFGEEGSVLRPDKEIINNIRFFDAMFGNSVNEIRKFLRNIKYIGPLRAKPERAYLAMGSPIDIGNSGENAVPILWLYQNDKILNKTKIGSEPISQKLVVAVQDWLQEFGIAYSFHITKPKRVIYQAELESAPGSNTMVTIADVGFGVSQLLPVIVAGLQASKGATLILEQPEIHLHPRLQGKLADFLICMVELEKKVIVETHSEHLINMLRLRIVQDKSGVLQRKIGIIFVRNWQLLAIENKEKADTNKLGSYIENLCVDQFGKIINWPPDFFPESTNLNEEILKAMMNKFTEGK